MKKLDENFSISLKRRWTFQGLERASQEPSGSPLAEFKKRIEIPLMKIKALNKATFSNILDQAQEVEKLRDTIVGRILGVGVLHSLAGVTLKCAKQKLDKIVMRYLSDLPPRRLSVGLAGLSIEEALEHLRLMLICRRQNCWIAVSCRRSDSSDEGHEGTISITVACRDRLKLFNAATVAINALAVTIVDAEMMNMKHGMVRSLKDIFRLCIIAHISTILAGHRSILYSPKT